LSIESVGISKLVTGLYVRNVGMPEMVTGRLCRFISRLLQLSFYPYTQKMWVQQAAELTSFIILPTRARAV